ncbi:MAG: LPS export ABC transporter periplasmic protein LptC [Deltaproteobacteria bacterium]|nr:MAG: LPS export ABC transporter periplasmic protein LptC [Deltaproteobacteria bacterium]
MVKQFWQRIRFIRWLLFLAMAAAVIAILAGLKVRSANESLPAIAAELTSKDGNLTLNNFEYRDVKKGNARLTVWADTATYFEDRKETVLDQVKAIFFLKNGGQVELLGERGVLHTDTNNMEISGNVGVTFGKDYKLTTDRLLYNRDKELIYTNEQLVLKGPGLTTKGQGMRLEIEKKSVSILRHMGTSLEGVSPFTEKKRRVS